MKIQVWGRIPFSQKTTGPECVGCSTRTSTGMPAGRGSYDEGCAGVRGKGTRCHPSIDRGQSHPLRGAHLGQGAHQALSGKSLSQIEGRSDRDRGHQYQGRGILQRLGSEKNSGSVSLDIALTKRANFRKLPNTQSSNHFTVGGMECRRKQSSCVPAVSPAPAW